MHLLGGPDLGHFINEGKDNIKEMMSSPMSRFKPGWFFETRPQLIRYCMTSQAHGPILVIAIGSQRGLKPGYLAQWSGMLPLELPS